MVSRGAPAEAIMTGEFCWTLQTELCQVEVDPYRAEIDERIEYNRWDTAWPKYTTTCPSHW